MERKRTKAVKRRVPQNKAAEKRGYGGGLMLRIYGSVLLVLAVIFIKQNAPEAVRAAQYALLEWTISLP